MKLVTLMPGLNAVRAEMKRAEKAKRIAFELDKAHHFALKEEAARCFEQERASVIAKKQSDRSLWLKGRDEAMAKVKARAAVKADSTVVIKDTTFKASELAALEAEMLKERA
jgi:hypothetical protein